MFYLYRQNNTEGHYIENNIIGKCVIIEENDIEEANIKAVSIGIYFNGVCKGVDCSCCGDRWLSEPEEYNSIDEIKNIYCFEFNFNNYPMYLYNFSMKLTIIRN